MTTELKCPRCGRDGHLPAECDVPVLPDGRVLREKPEALRRADELEADPLTNRLGFVLLTAEVLRTQHAAIERKDALLRQARLHVASNIAVNSGDSKAEDLYDAITKELQ